MRTWKVDYVDVDGMNETIEVEIEDDEGPSDAEEEARTQLTARNQSVDTDEWEIDSVQIVEAPSP